MEQQTIQIMLNNRIYLGETTFRDITATNAHQAIISQEDFDLAGRILTERGETSAAAPPTPATTTSPA